MLGQLCGSSGGGPVHPYTARKAVGVKGYLAKNFREATRTDTPVEFHLPQPFLRMNIALCEKQVVFILGIDMGHAIAVCDDFNSLVQSVRMYFALCLGKGTVHEHVVCSTGQSCQTSRRCKSFLPPGCHGLLLLFQGRSTGGVVPPVGYGPAGYPRGGPLLN